MIHVQWIEILLLPTLAIGLAGATDFGGGFAAAFLFNFAFTISDVFLTAGVCLTTDVIRGFPVFDVSLAVPQNKRKSCYHQKTACLVMVSQGFYECSLATSLPWIPFYNFNNKIFDQKNVPKYQSIRQT